MHIVQALCTGVAENWRSLSAMLSFNPEAMNKLSTTSVEEIALQRLRQPLEAWQHVGNTPLLRLPNIAADLPGVEIYGKAEWFNPGGSVKDRPALSMILDGERKGLLTKEKIILDATSGNTGIAYAWIGAARGYRV
jgi:cysteine synthase B